MLTLLLGEDPGCSSHALFQPYNTSTSFPLRWAQYRKTLPQDPSDPTVRASGSTIQLDRAAACTACDTVERLGANLWPRYLPVMQGHALQCSHSGGPLYYMDDSQYSDVSVPMRASPVMVWPPSGGRKGAVVYAAMDWQIGADGATQQLLEAVVQLAKPGERRLPEGRCSAIDTC